MDDKDSTTRLLWLNMKRLCVDLLTDQPDEFKEKQSHYTFAEDGFSVTFATEFVEWMREKVERQKKEEAELSRKKRDPEDMARGFEAIAAEYTERAKAVRERSA